ncbi:unnamed protein product [Effrenium voratum]|nr:unnamed protein product [Effrenium voratum]
MVQLFAFFVGIAVCSAGDFQADQADLCKGLAADEESLQLLQRSARSKAQESAPALLEHKADPKFRIFQPSAFFRESLQQLRVFFSLNATSLAAGNETTQKELRRAGASSFATGALQYLSLLDSELRRAQPASLVIGLWVLGFSSFLCYMLSSVGRTRSEDGAKGDATLESALSASWRNFSFTWMDGVHIPKRGLSCGAMRSAWVMEEKKGSEASLRRALLRVVGGWDVLACSWSVALLESVGLVLALDVLLSLDHSGKPLHVTTMVIMLLFVAPLLHRYLSAVLAMLDGKVAFVAADLSSLIFEKALRLPIGSMYHSHVGDSGFAASGSVAKTMVAAVTTEWQRLLKTLALMTAAPISVLALLLLMMLHMRTVSFICMSSLIPGSIIAFLVVKSAISFRNEYLSWQGERRRCLGALTSRDPQLLDRIQHARDRELDANQWYSVMLGLLVANLHLMVWIIVVASIYLSLLHQETSARKMWVVLQCVTSLQASTSLGLAGLRRALAVPGVLHSAEIFLRQPEMPPPVPLPQSGTPIARISGSFSYEEEGPAVLNLELALTKGERLLVLGPPGAGKSALLQAFLGELFPCGLSCVACASRSYCAQKPWIVKATARENILLEDAASAQEVAKLDVRTADLMHLGISSSLDSPVDGNDCVRIMLARLLHARPPELILVDDILAELPEQEAEEVLEAFLAASSSACIVASSRPLCPHRFDRVLQLRGGCIEGQTQAQPETEASARAMQPLAVLGNALEMAQRPEDWRIGKPPDLSLFQLALVWLQNSGACNLWLCAILVLLQRLVQLLQLLLLAAWGDQAVQSDCDHRSFATSLLAVMACNALLLLASEWAGSRVAHASGTALHGRLLSALDQQKDLKSALHAFDDLDQVDGLVISVLASMRSCLGSFFQQGYILLIAPQWLALTVLLPLYICIIYFAYVYLRSSLPLACARSETSQLLEDSLADPVSVRGNRLTAFFTSRVASANASTALRLWFCVAFIAAACALHLLLCEQRVGVGTFGLVLSLLFALPADLEAACDSIMQGCVTLGALRRLKGTSHLVHELDRPKLTRHGQELQDELGPVLRCDGDGLQLLGKRARRLFQLEDSEEDYHIVSVNGVAFDAEAMVDELQTEGDRIFLEFRCTQRPQRDCYGGLGRPPWEAECNEAVPGCSAGAAG